MKKKAFTLIELLVVIAIIGVLAALALTNYNASRRNARDSRRLGDIRNIVTALEQYYTANSAYPNTNGVTTSSYGDPLWIYWIPGLVPDYFDRVPEDPQNYGSCARYMYTSQTLAQTYELVYYLERDANDAVGSHEDLNDSCGVSGSNHRHRYLVVRSG